MEYDLEPLREKELCDLRTDGIFQAPIMNFFSFFSGGMGRGGKAKGNDNFPSWFLSENERCNLQTIFFRRLMKFSMKLKQALLKLTKS